MKTEDWNKLNEIFHQALEMEPAEREKFIESECKDAPELKKELEKMLASAESETDFLKESALGEIGDYPDRAENLEGRIIDDFRIIKEVGHGGMGTVYLAEHEGEGFSQKVALKLIKRGMDTNVVLKRFLLERQILASLEHPHIARLLDGGSTADGLPYFAMEYIEGDPLREFCDDQQFDTSERLEIFVKVCRAVSYAHQKLVVHRDLKPSNILVTADGTPKLLDFGIGKILSPDWNETTAEATATQMRLMTPEYASPEQLRGQITTTLTDVYSLGVVLYELLTGTRPYNFESSNPVEISEKLSTEEPLKPSDAITRGQSDTVTDANNSQFVIRNSQLLLGDLDNIILKAINKDTERRYRSVQELADDIERYLNGLPVTATADSNFYRLKKFVKRHRTGVFSALGVTILLVTATAVTGWQYFRAQKAQAKAEQRFGDVRKLANSVVFDLHDAIRDLPGATPARELLVRNALEYLDKLAGEAENDPTLQVELSDAYDKIGDVQGGYGQFHLGQRKNAKESYQKALAITNKLYQSNPNDLLFRRKFALSNHKIGTVFMVEAKLDESLKYFQKSSEIYEKLSKDYPDDVDIDSNLANTYAFIGYVLTNRKETSGADKYYQKANSITEKLLTKHPEKEAVLKRSATIYESKGISLALQSKSAESLKYYKKAEATVQKLLSIRPLSVFYRMQNARLSYLQGISTYNVEEEASPLEVKLKSLEYLTKAKEIYGELLATDPQNRQFRSNLSNTQTLRAKVFNETGSPDQAITILEDALKVFQRQKKNSPNANSLAVNIAIVHEKLGEAYAMTAKTKAKSAPEKLKNWQTARDYFQKSYQSLKKLSDEGNLFGIETNKIKELEEDIAECEEIIRTLNFSNSNGEWKMKN